MFCLKGTIKNIPFNINNTGRAKQHDKGIYNKKKWSKQWRNPLINSIRNKIEKNIFRDNITKLV